MTIYSKKGDGIIGEKLRIEFRKLSKPKLIAGSGRHRAQAACLIGAPARCWIEKEIRSLEK
jgi:hypothetical protein